MIPKMLRSSCSKDWISAFGLDQILKMGCKLDKITKSNLGFDLDQIVSLCFSKLFGKIRKPLIQKIRITLIPAEEWISGKKI